ncbi:hypothetical protein GDO81_023158 [Engystomops pustulosus]|uniref:UPAR/Ly6 domain-containing protein n=1 Tax=Engystomops pustulosus TaxID=76066 RepID=A0AAV6ZHU2_ENGPU|nr:hypothetical protein GDO81_023158 [Engystomops pustulosus]
MCDKNQDTCISTITEISTQGKTTPTKYIVRSCGTKDTCNTNYSISLNATTLHATIRCCDKDRCPTPGLDVPKAINQNDVECPTCHEANDKCKTTMKIKCTGEQKKCVTYTAKDTKTQTTYSIQGCASENVCAMKNVTTLPFDHILSTKFDCSSHAASQLPGLFFPVAVVIATLKLLS